MSGPTATVVVHRGQQALADAAAAGSSGPWWTRRRLAAPPTSSSPGGRWARPSLASVGRRRPATPSTGRGCTCGGATSGTCPPATPSATRPRTTRGLARRRLDPAKVHAVAGPATSDSRRGQRRGLRRGPARGRRRGVPSTSSCSGSAPTATSPRCSPHHPASATSGRHRRGGARLPQAAADPGVADLRVPGALPRGLVPGVRGRQGRSGAARGLRRALRDHPRRARQGRAPRCGWSTPLPAADLDGAEHHGSVRSAARPRRRTRRGPTTTRTPSAARPATRPRAEPVEEAWHGRPPPTRRRPWSAVLEG